MTGPDLSPKDASEHTAAANAAVHAHLPFSDRADFERASRGRIAGPPPPLTPGGFSVWDLTTFDFLDGDAPPTVNPSLWRQAQLNCVAGLFEVCDGIYQVRGLDLSNVTFVAGESGWIVIDPLTSSTTARAALDLVTEHLGARPVHTVIYTHSHVDHFGGVRGIVDEEAVRGGAVRIFAPEGFLRAAVSENVIAGNVMTRRATYMYGALLPRGPKGHVDAGLGKGVPLGPRGLIAPTDTVTDSGSEMTIDGMRLVFQLTPGTEAPAEMNFAFPDHRALCMAENCTGVLHNLYTPRGAEIRDALAWSKYIDESIEWFAATSDVVFASHHWPRWGDDVVPYLGKQRDAYRYLHDQTMRLANHGLTPVEIAEELVLPPGLGDEFFNRDYYGTVSHNVKAVYQRYLGWFDGNPASLHRLPPVDAARRYVEFMGGADDLLRKARASFELGEYRWVAEVANHLVFAEPENLEARALQADTLEQLAYQAESGPWRAFYLTAAQELRHGVPDFGPMGAVAGDTAAAMTVEMLLDFLAVRIDGPRAAGRRFALDIDVTDRDERWAVSVEHGTLRAVSGRDSEHAAVRLTLEHAALAALVLGERAPRALVADGALQLEGDETVLEDLFACCETFDTWFPIVTP
ncbi:MAG: MBL fold metallo-hydrolase [Actinobacteria bacterium]|nr:MBL fold metallo-hydrolase [Actinomycetota bacterium]